MKEQFSVVSAVIAAGFIWAQTANAGSLEPVPTPTGRAFIWA